MADRGRRHLRALAAAGDAPFRHPHLGNDGDAEGSAALERERPRRPRLADQQDSLPQPRALHDRLPALPPGASPTSSSRCPWARRWCCGASSARRDAAGRRGARRPRPRGGARDDAADSQPRGGDASRYELPTLRITSVSGSALPGELATKWMDHFGDNVYNLYGSTEVAYATIATREDLRSAPGTCRPAAAGDDCLPTTRRMTRSGR